MHKRFRYSIFSLILIALIANCGITVIAQESYTERYNRKYKMLVDNIEYVQSVPYIENCNDRILWEIVDEGIYIIPFLIDKISDDTPLKDVYVPIVGGEYAVGDVALIALQEIVANVPVNDLLETSDKDMFPYWNKIREGKNVRVKFQQALKDWHEYEYRYYKSVETSQSTTGDCFMPNRERYEYTYTFEHYKPFRQLACGLWINTNNDIAYKTIAVGPSTYDTDDDFDTIDCYIDQTYDRNAIDTLTYETELRNIVDTLTFEFVGKFHFKDKNHAYSLIPMSDGGHWWMSYDIDPNKFHALENPFYATDGQNCYLLGRPIDGADAKTFKLLFDDEDSFIAKDKNHFYNWHEIMTDEDITSFKEETGIDLEKL